MQSWKIPEFLYHRNWNYSRIENSPNKIADIIKLPNYKITEMENSRYYKISEYQQLKEL